MRILKIAISTLLIGLAVIFAFPILKEGDSRAIGNILCLIPFVIGLYITASGIVASVKEKAFRVKIIYGIILTSAGVIFWLYMGLNILKYIYF